MVTITIHVVYVVAIVYMQFYVVLSKSYFGG